MALKEIWVHLVQKEALVSKDQGETLESRAFQENQGKWDHQASMDKMEKREDQELQELQDLQDFLDRGDNLDSTAALDQWDKKE